MGITWKERWPNYTPVEQPRAEITEISLSKGRIIDKELYYCSQCHRSRLASLSGKATMLQGKIWCAFCIEDLRKEVQSAAG